MRSEYEKQLPLAELDRRSILGLCGAAANKSEAWQEPAERAPAMPPVACSRCALPRGPKVWQYSEAAPEGCRSRIWRRRLGTIGVVHE